MAGLDNFTAVAAPCPIVAIRTRIEQIVSDEVLQKKGELRQCSYENQIL